jgi:hypothetical protein
MWKPNLLFESEAIVFFTGCYDCRILHNPASICIEQLVYSRFSTWPYHRFSTGPYHFVSYACDLEKQRAGAIERRQLLPLALGTTWILFRPCYFFLFLLIETYPWLQFLVYSSPWQLYHQIEAIALHVIKTCCVTNFSNMDILLWSHVNLSKHLSVLRKLPVGTTVVDESSIFSRRGMWLSLCATSAMRKLYLTCIFVSLHQQYGAYPTIPKNEAASPKLT